MSRHIHGIAAAAIAATLVLPTAMMTGCGGAGEEAAQTQGGSGSASQEQLFDEFGNKKVTEHLEGIYDFLKRKKMENLNELERKK